jgi:tetratricopeptide (TPR) repeat protein
LVALLAALSMAPLLVRFLYPVHEYFVEYRLYPAMPWFAILYAFALQGIANRKGPAVVRFLPHGVLACFAILSVMRAQDWRSPFSIGENVLSQYPNHVRVHSYLQAYEMQAGEPEKAIARQKRLREASANLRAYNKRWARHHRRYDVSNVLASLMSGEQMAGMAEIQLYRPEDALRRLDATIAAMKINFGGKDPGRGFAVLYRTRGMAHAALGNPDAARSDFEKALERLPGDQATLQAIRWFEAGAPRAVLAFPNAGLDHPPAACSLPRSGSRPTNNDLSGPRDLVVNAIAGMAALR